MTEHEHPVYSLYKLKIQQEELEANQNRINDILTRPIKEVQEETQKEIDNFLNECNDEEWDDHFQNGGGHGY
jgi:hypothetical protein